MNDDSNNFSSSADAGGSADKNLSDANSGGLLDPRVIEQLRDADSERVAPILDELPLRGSVSGVFEDGPDTDEADSMSQPLLREDVEAETDAATFASEVIGNEVKLSPDSSPSDIPIESLPADPYPDEPWDELSLTQDYLDNLPTRNAEEAAGIVVKPLTGTAGPAATQPNPVFDATSVPQRSPLTQEELDAFIAAQVESQRDVENIAVTAKKESSGLSEGQDSVPSPDEELSQEELDALFSGQTASASPVAPAPEEDKELSQAELDALFSGQTASASPVAPAAEEDKELSQAELDTLFSGQAATPSASEPPELERSATLSQEELEPLLQQAMQKQAEKPVRPERQPVAEATPVPDSLTINQDELDALINGASQKTAPEEVASQEDEEISQELIDSIIAAAQGKVDTAPVARENKAAAEDSWQAPKPAPDKGQLSQDDLDALLVQARKQDREKQLSRQRALEEALSGKPSAPVDASAEAVAELTAAPITSKTRKRERKLGTLLTGVVPPLLRLAASVGVAVGAGWGAYRFLDARREIVPDFAHLMEWGGTDVTLAMRRANTLMASGHYHRAAMELEDALAYATPGRDTVDARYMLIEARFNSLLRSPDFEAHQPLHTLIDKVVAENTEHRRAPEALYWKAKIYEMDGIPYAAREIYEKIADFYGDSKVIEPALLDAALLALELRDPGTSAQYAQRLLSRFPQSPHRVEARLILADAYAASGMYDDARTLYVRSADEAGSAHELWSRALLSLGRLAMQQRNFNESIHHFRLRLERTLSAEDNDENHLLLGQAFHQAGRLEEARNVLSDMIRFFPHSPFAPEAMIEMSQVLDRLGRRQEALRIAQNAAGQFPDNPRVLENKAEFLGLTGNPYGAALALMAADEAGASNPTLPLKAARYFQAGGALEDAKQAYALLRRKYALSTEALTGGIEHALIVHNQGDTIEAARQLEELLVATRGKPQQLQALSAMADIYRELGLREALRQTAAEMASLATAPEMLARTAMDLLDAGDPAGADSVVRRLDLDRLREETAYALLSRLGNALMQVEPARGLNTLEQAYRTYPAARTTRDTELLLKAYLDLGQNAQARRMVMELVARQAEEPVLAATLFDAAVAWGNHLMQQADYRTAAEAFHIAIETARDNGEALRNARQHPTWAKFQRANAFMALAEYDRSLELYNEVSATNSPWSEEARVKAAQAELEMRMRSAAYAGARREG